MTKPIILQLLAFMSAGLSMLLVSCGDNTKPPAHPNVIMIITDDQGWGDLGVNGNPHLNTPNIDHLAHGGVQFFRFYVSPVCSPTRAELLTGRFHPRGGIYSTSQGGERLDLDEQTLAEIFKFNGYQTAAFGKWHNGSQGPYHPNSRGFDEFYGFCSGHWGNYFSPMLERNTEIVQGEGFIIDDLTDKAIQFIESSNGNPFFTYIAYNTPHSPMQVPDEWWNKYKDLEIDESYQVGEKESIPKTLAAWALCENVDWNIGRIMDKLENLNLLENTIIIFLSDNGPNSWRWNDGLKGIKGHTDEGGVRSPFILYWKGKLEPSQIDQVASSIDVLPTLTDLANLPIQSDKALDGISLKPLLLGEGQSWEDRYVYSHWNGKVSVRNRRYLLDHSDQLFDLVTDPGQNSALENPSDSLFSTIMDAKQKWVNEVLGELDRERKEVFPVGFEGSRYTHLPARDAASHGNLIRSSRHPNASHFSHWKSLGDSISWDCEIIQPGRYKAVVYYTCKATAIGSIVSLKQGENEVQAEIKQAYDPPFIAVEYDRVERDESYEKDFQPLELGVLNLDQGLQQIVLKAQEIKGPELMDFRLLLLERID